MKIGPQYKIARRLGAPIFEKTQTAKFALSAEKKAKNKRGRPGNRTDFGAQLTEKQKARYFYGVTEKQFKNYVKKVLDNPKVKPASELYSLLESRLDNTVWRLGIAPTHRSARIMVAHGHITLNGKRIYSPSYSVRIGDKLGIREGSKKSPLFNQEGKEAKATPAWLSFDPGKMEAEIKGRAAFGENELLFDISKVIEFYQR